MKILVCIAHVPDTTSKISFTDGNMKLNTQGMQFVIGPYEDFALARAVELKESNGAHVTVLNVGGAETEPTIRKALAIGADDAIRINAEPKDSFFVAQQIAKVAQKDDYTMILMGRESSDYNGGQVHGMVAELLGWPSITPAMTLEINGDKATMKREIEGGHEVVECSFPFVAGCQEPIADWKIPNMRGIMSARTKPLNVVEPEGDDSRIDLVAYEMPAEKGDVQLIDAENIDELISKLKNEAKVL